MQRFELFAFASALVSLVACAGPSSADEPVDVGGAGEATAELRAFDATLVGTAASGLRADLRDALGQPPSETEDATVAGVLGVREEFGEEDRLVADVLERPRQLRPGTFDLVFPGLDVAEAGVTNALAKKLYDAMTNARVTTRVTHVGQDTTRTSPGGSVACTFVISFNPTRPVYSCRIKGLTDFSQARPGL